MTSFRNTDGRNDLYAKGERERVGGREECERKRYIHAAIIRVPNRSRRPISAQLITRNRCVYIQDVPNGQAHEGIQITEGVRTGYIQGKPLLKR